MRATVLTEARLMKLAGRFAWLDIDTEKAVNFPFVERFPIEAWPTVYAIDPGSEQVLLRWMGTATAAELERLLLDAEQTYRKEHPASPPQAVGQERGAVAERTPARPAAGQERTGAAAAALARGVALAAGRQHSEAARAFSDALAAGGPGWPERTRTVDALMQALAAAGDGQACAGAAAELLPRLEQGPAYARAAAAGLGCAAEVEEPASREPAIRAVEPYARVALGIPGVLADDRSGLYERLVDARHALGDEPGAKRVAREWLAFVEDEARRARTPLARSAFDGGRLSAALALGDPRRALPALRASAQALPDEYFAQSYQAVCALEAGEPKEALEAARRAVALADGPRRVRVMTVEAQALHALGDEEAAHAALEAAIAHGEGLPEAVRPRGHLAAARKLLEAWGPTATATATPTATPTPPPTPPPPPTPTSTPTSTSTSTPTSTPTSKP